MRDAILGFAKQFKYSPAIEGGKVKKYKKYIIAGMGGSHLAADIVSAIDPSLDITVWSDYAPRSVVFKNTLIIASSYSGNTEESVDWLNAAIAQGQPVVAIGVGGKVIEIAKSRGVPYIQLPNSGIQPRSALGYSLLAMLKVLKRSDLLRGAKSLAKSLQPSVIESAGKALAEKLSGRIPVIYTSARNYAIAYNWKIKFNETGKIPAFYNLLPELNHNEMTGFDVKPGSEALARPFHFVFLVDEQDHPRVQKRFQVLQRLYAERNLPVESVSLNTARGIEGAEARFYNIFYSLVLADWAAVHTATAYGLESEQVPMVEEFKRLIA